MVEIESFEDAKIPNYEWQELMGQDLVYKIIEKGRQTNNKEPEPVKPHDAVFIDFVGRLSAERSITDGPIFQKVENWFIIVGDGDVLPALELAIRFMDTGQTARVWSHSKYALSNGTRTYENIKVPPNTNVMFEVTVKQIVIDTSRLNPYFTIQKALNRKTIANDIYQHEYCPPPKSDTEPDCEAAMGRAIRLYQKASKEMETLLDGTYFRSVEADHPQRHQSTQIMLDSLNNICAVYLKQKKYNKAKQSAVEVLKIDRKNIKALLRAAKASLLDPASSMEEVQAALDAAEEHITYKNPQEEKELKRLRAQFKKKQQEYKSKTKEMFANKLLAKSTPQTSKDVTEAVSPEEEQEPSAPESATKGNDTDVQSLRNEEAVASDPPRSQAFSIYIQLFVALALFILYRSLNTTTSEIIAPEESLVTSENGGPSDEINLDL